MTRGLLFSQMEPPPGWEDEFHDWYNRDHIPRRLEIPGFESAARYEALEGESADFAPGRYLACYFLSDMAALDSPEYARLKSGPDERTARMLDNVRGFTRYVRRYLRRHFHAVRLVRAGRPEAPAEGPLVIVLNHPSWWDPLVGAVLAGLFPIGAIRCL